MTQRPLSVVQLLPALEVGGVEQGTLEVARELSRLEHHSLVISAPGRMVTALRADGSEHLPWTIGAKSPLSLRWVKPLRRLLSERKVDILHARSRLPAWIAVRALAKMAPATRPAFVTTVHGPYTVNRYSAVMMRGDTVIAISEHIKNYIVENYPHTDAARIEVIHRGVAEEEFPYGYQAHGSWLQQWYQDYPKTRDKFLVTLPGRITRWKGHADFIEVIARLRQHGVPVHGLVAGGDAARRERFLRELNAKVVAHNLSEHITFLGQRQDMRDVMAVSNVVLSLANVPEAFGRTTLEALRIGRPVVGYDHGGTHEILAAMFPEGACAAGDHTAVAERLEEFYRAPPTPADTRLFLRQEMLDKTLGVYARLQR
jgi:glycosyltransferase involved in cell wall biosynthesis